MKIGSMRTCARTEGFQLLSTLVLLLVPASCRASWRADDDRRFDELQARLDADIATADAAKDAAAALPEGTEREQPIEALDDVVMALIWAKAAAATALMAGDPAALERIETERRELMALASRVVPSVMGPPPLGETAVPK